jgi:ribonuclease-3
VEAFLDPLLSSAVQQIRAGKADRDPKSQLQEWVQARGLSAPQYRIVSESGPDHSKYFHVEVVVGGKSLGRGEGRSKQAASKAAASEAMKKMEG